MMVLTQANAHVQASVSHVTTASQDSKSMLQWEIEFLEEQVLGISRRNTQSPADVEDTAIEDGEMLGNTNEGDPSPAVYVENCSPDLSVNCSITSSNKNSLAHTLSLISQASQYYSSGKDNSVAFDIRNIIYESKSHLWQHSMEDLLHAEILISLKTGFTAGKTKLSPSYMEQSLSELPSHQRNKRKYEDLKNENIDSLNDSVKSLNNKQKIDLEGIAVNEDSPFVLSDVQKSKSLVLSKAIKGVMTDLREMNAASVEMCPRHRIVCGCTKTRDVYLSSGKRLQRGDEHAKKDHLSSPQYLSVSSKTYQNCFGRFQCLSCPKSFPSRHQLQIHAVYHSKPRFKCLMCDKAFYHLYQLQVHQISHTGMPQYVCRRCNQSFLFAFSRRMHMRLHTSIRILRRMLQSAQASDGVTTKTKNTLQLL